MDSMIGSFLAIGGPGYMNLADFVELYSDRLPAHLFPIADDPGGNVIVMSCEGRTRGAVYFWDHEKTGKRSIRRGNWPDSLPSRIVGSDKITRPRLS